MSRRNVFSIVFLALLSVAHGQGALGGAGVAIPTPAGSFIPTTAVTDQIQYVATVKTIKDNIANSKYEEAKADFKSNSYMANLSNGVGLSGPDFELFKSYFGNATANYDYLMMSFGATVESSKNEMIEKTVADAIPVRAILSLAQAQTRPSWDQACALYIGDVALKSSVYDRANKRGANFKTEFELPGGSKQANANKAVIDACVAGPSDETYGTILRNILITYAQASIRYAYLVDVDVTSVPERSTDDHRAEGQAFYRIIAPYVKRADTACDLFMVNMYDLAAPLKKDGTYYCQAVKCLPKALNLTSAEIGVLEDTENSCKSSPGGPAGPSPSTGSSNSSSVAYGYKSTVMALLSMAAVLVFQIAV